MLHLTVGCPPHIGYYFGLGHRISFTRKDCDVFTFDPHPTVKICKLKIPSLPDIPLEVGLFSKRLIRWFLNHNFIPVLKDKEVTFIQGATAEHDPQITHILRASNQIMKRLIKLKENQDHVKLYPEWLTLQMALNPKEFTAVLDLTCTLLKDFRTNLLNKNHDTAHSCLLKAYEATYKSIIFKELYADFLFFRKCPEAAILYFELIDEKNNNETSFYFEKAIRSDPENENIFTFFRSLTCSDAVKMHYYLTAYLACSDKTSKLAQSYLQEALDLQIEDGIAQIVQVRFLPDAVKKSEYYKTLSQLMQTNANVQASQYFAEKSQKNAQNSTWQQAQRKRIHATESFLQVERSSQDSPKEQYRKSPNYQISGGAPTKLYYIKYVNKLLKQQRYNDAASQICEARIKCGEKGSFYKRLLIAIKYLSALQTKNIDLTENECLERLFWLYHEKQKWYKAELVGRVLYQREKKFDVGKTLAACLHQQSKTPESAQLLFTIAKSEYNKSCLSKLHASLLELEQIDPTYGSFTQNNRQIIYLLTLFAAKYNLSTKLLIEKALQLRTSGLSKEVSCTNIASYAHFGEGAYFKIDHPENVACWFSISKRIIFTKTRAKVYSLLDGQCVEYPLHLPAGAPEDIQLYKAQTIRWFLSSGYLPTEVNLEITFINPKSRARQLKSLVVEQARQLQKAIPQNNLPKLLAHLDNFVGHLADDNASLAHDCIQKAYVESRSSPIPIQVADLYAEFLALLEIPEAVEIFQELSTEMTPKGTLHYLQRALSASCAMHIKGTERIYAKIFNFLCQKQTSSQHLAEARLHAFLYLKSNDAASEEELQVFYNRSSNEKTNPCIPWGHLACLDRRARHERSKVFDTLAGFFDPCDPQNAHIHKFYILKRDLETSVNSKKSLDAFITEIFLDKTSLPKDLSQFAAIESFPKKIRAIKKAIPKGQIKELATCIASIEKHAQNQQYIQLEQCILAARKITQETQQEILIKDIHSEYLQFIKISDPQNPILSDFFQSELFDYFLRQINEALDELPKHIRTCIAALNAHLQKKKYEAARDCLQQAHALTCGPPVYELVSDLYYDYVKAPSMPSWEENFEQFFSTEQIFLPASEDNTDTAITEYLRLYGIEKESELNPLLTIGLRARPKINSICTLYQSKLLAYLERALDVALKIDDPRAADIYGMILEKLQKDDAPPGMLFLLCLHAFFYLRSRNLEEAEFFYQEAVRLNRDNPLLGCARIARYGKQEKFKKVEEYNRLINLFGDATKCAHHLLMQKFFNNNVFFLSSLQQYVKSECKAILSNQQLAQFKDLGITIIDSLIEKGIYKYIPAAIEKIIGILRGVIPGWSRYANDTNDKRFPNERFSLSKREFTCYLQLGKPLLMGQALQKLHAVYDIETKPENQQLVTKLLEDTTKKPFNVVAKELLAENKHEQAARLYFEHAFRAVRNKNWYEAEDCVQFLKTQDPNFFDADEKLILTLIESLLPSYAVKIASSQRLEASFKDLQI